MLICLYTCCEKAYRGRGGIALLILNLSTRWKWMVSLTPGCFLPWEEAPDRHLRKGCVGPTVSLGILEKEKISRPCQDANPAHSTVTMLTELSSSYNYWPDIFNDTVCVCVLILSDICLPTSHVSAWLTGKWNKVKEECKEVIGI
jgi:hypothetical protein